MIVGRKIGSVCNYCGIPFVSRVQFCPRCRFATDSTGRFIHLHLERLVVTLVAPLVFVVAWDAIIPRSTTDAVAGYLFGVCIIFVSLVLRSFIINRWGKWKHYLDLQHNVHGAYISFIREGDPGETDAKVFSVSRFVLDTLYVFAIYAIIVGLEFLHVIPVI